jgi:hypothetical protein
MAIVGYKCIEKVQNRKRKQKELRMPFNFPGERVPSAEKELPTNTNLIDDIVNRGRN